MTRLQGRKKTILRRGRMSLESRPAHLAADIAVRIDDTDSDASGFLVLINYLSGFNSEHRPVALEAPIEQSADDDWQLTQKAVPSEPGLYKSIRYNFPYGSIIGQYPEPADPRIRLRAIASQQTASIWFAGAATQERLLDQTHQLQDFIALNGYVAMMPVQRPLVKAARCGPFRAFTKLSIEIADWPATRYVRPGSNSHRAPGLMLARRTSSL